MCSGKRVVAGQQRQLGRVGDLQRFGQGRGARHRLAQQVPATARTSTAARRAMNDSSSVLMTSLVPALDLEHAGERAPERAGERPRRAAAR